MASSSTAIDLTTLEEIEAGPPTTPVERHTCAICQREDNLLACHNANNSIQCNPQITTLGLCFDQEIFSDQHSTGCKAWFHKTCLKKWHRKSTSGMVDENATTPCPLCRGKHTFIWSYASDSELQKCIFREDFLQYALVTGAWDAQQVEKECKSYGMSLQYENSPENAGIPFWINTCRKNGCLLRNAIVGNDLATVQYLVYHGAHIPGVNIDLDEEDEATLRVGVGATADSLLLRAAQVYADSEVKSLDIFKFLYGLGDLYEQEMKVVVLHPHREDTFLYAIRKGLVFVVREMVSDMLTKHSWPMLLQWCLKAGVASATYVFPVLVGAMQHGKQVVRLESALLACAETPALVGTLYDLVYSYIPRGLKMTFMVQYLKTCIIVGNTQQVFYVLFRPGNDFDELGFGEPDANNLLIFLSQCFFSRWTTTFGFAEGFERRSFSHTPTTLRSFRTLMNGLVPGGKQRGLKKKWPHSRASELLMKWEKEVNEREIRSDPAVQGFNMLELLLLRMRASGIKSSAPVLHGVLNRAVRMIQEHVTLKSEIETLSKRLLVPLVIFAPDCINDTTTKQNVLLFVAEYGMHEVFNLVFLNMEPEFNQIKNAEGDGALHLAIRNGHFEMASLILVKLMVQELFEEMNAKNSRGRTPLMMCSLYDVPKRRGTAESNRKRKRMVQEQKRKKMLLFAQEFLSMRYVASGINDQDADGNTALHLAYARDNKDLIVLLKRHRDVKIDIRNNLGRIAHELKVR